VRASKRPSATPHSIANLTWSDHGESDHVYMIDDEGSQERRAAVIDDRLDAVPLGTWVDGRRVGTSFQPGRPPPPQPPLFVDPVAAVPLLPLFR
jgi:hypothetical protein